MKPAQSSLRSRYVLMDNRGGCAVHSVKTAKILIAGVLGAGALFIAAAPTPAMAYDMDCKVILCLAGGFPTGCGDAYRYMIDRITARPPKPPFG